MKLVTVEWHFKQNYVEPVAWVDMQLFDRFWKEAEDYVGSNGFGSNQPDKYERVGEYLMNFSHLDYPFVSLDDRDHPFSDGRHRTAWLRDHGSAAIPFPCSPHETAKQLRHLFGTGVRKAVYHRP